MKAYLKFVPLKIKFSLAVKVLNNVAVLATFFGKSMLAVYLKNILSGNYFIFLIMTPTF